MYKMELSRAINNKKLYFSLFIGICIVIAHFILDTHLLVSDMMQVKDHTDFGIQYAAKVTYAPTALLIWIGTRVSSESVLFFFILPLLAAIPYGASYCNDINSGYINNIVSRGKKRDYFRAKLFTVFLTGGLVAVIPLLFSMILSMCFLPIGSPVSGLGQYPVLPFSFMGDLFYTNTALYVTFYFLFDFMFFGLLNVVCLIFTFIEKNQFFILATPFLLWFAFHTFCGWILGKVQYSPKEYTFLPNFIDGTQNVVCFQIIILIIVSFVFLLGSKNETVS